MKTNNENFEKLNQELGFEFGKYVLMHSEILEKIPLGAQIVFLMEENPEFNAWSKEVNARQREHNQPVVFIHISHLLPEACRLVNPHIEIAA